jgi:hypothetical protein
MGGYANLKKGGGANLPYPEEQPRAESDGGFSFGKMLSSVPGDLVEIASGLSALFGTGVQDLRSGVIEAATLGNAERDFRTDDLVKALTGYQGRSGFAPDFDLSKSVVVQDYQSRYGSKEGFVEGLEEDPLAFIGDLLTVATLGGAGAAKGAQATAKVGSVADDLARMGAGAADDVGRTAKIVDAILPGAKQRAVAERAGETFRGSLGGTRQNLDATGQRVVEELRPKNPVTRAIQEQFTHRITRTPVKNLESTRDRLGTLMGDGNATTSQVVDYELLTRATDLASEAGARRVRSPNIESVTGPRRTFSNNALRSQTAKMIGTVTGRHVGARDNFTAGVMDRLKPLNDEIGADAVENFHVTMQFDTPKSTGRLRFDAIEDVLAEPKTLRQQELASVLADDIARVRQFETEMADPALLRESPHAQTLVKAHLDDLRKQGKTFEPFIRRVDQLSPDESAALDATLQTFASESVEKAKRLVQGLTESLDEGNDVLANAFDDVNVLRHKELTTAYINERGPMAYASAFDRAYLPLQRALKHKIEGRLPSKGAPFEGVVNDLYKALDEPTELPSTLEMDEAMQMLGRKMPGYFPNLFPSGNKSDFLMKIGGNAQQGMRKQSVPLRYKKAEGVLLDDFLRGQKQAYVTNPAEAYTRAASQIIRHQETENFIQDFVTSLGRPIEAFEEASVGESVINLDGVRMLLRKRSDTLSKTDDYIAAGQEIDESLADAVKESLADLPEEVARSLGETGRLYAVPKIAAKQLQALTKGSMGGKTLRLFWDGPINMWRQYVLYTRPAYYVNNVLGNTTFLKLQGGSMTGVLRQVVSKKYRQRVQDAIPESIRPSVTQGFYSDVSQRSRNMGEAADTVTGRFATAVKTSKAGQATGRVRDWLQDFNSNIENLYRRESAMTAIEKQMSMAGMKKAGKSFYRSKKLLDQITEFGVDEKVAQRALADVQATMNDYLALQPWERNTIRRFISPFYPFFKHAAITLTKMPFKTPGKARVLELLGQVQEDLTADLGPMPEWLEGFTPIGEGSQPGSTRFQSTRAANPFEGVFENPLAQLSPALQIGLEQVTGRDTFTGRPFSSGDVYNDPFSGQQYALDPETGTSERLERGLGGLRAPVAPTLLETLMGIAPPPLQIAQDLLGGGARYSATGEVIEGPDGKPLYPNDPSQEILKYLGFSTVDYNLQNYQEKDKAAQLRALNALLGR